jgi:hypothetical protein
LKKLIDSGYLKNPDPKNQARSGYLKKYPGSKEPLVPSVFYTLKKRAIAFQELPVL